MGFLDIFRASVKPLNLDLTKGGTWLGFSQNDFEKFSLSNYTNRNRAFESCATVLSIVTKISEAATSGEITSNTNLTAFSISEFITKTIHSLLVFGCVYLKATDDETVLEIVTPLEAEERNLSLDGYSLMLDLPQLKVNETGVYPARLEGLENEVMNLLLVQDAIYSLNYNRGAIGVLSSAKADAAGYAPLTKNERKRIEEMVDSYGITTSKKRVFFSEVPLNWSQMEFSVRDLMLFEGIDSNIKAVAMAFHYPYELIAGNQNSTYANKSEATAEFYSATIVPLAGKICEAFKAVTGFTFSVDYKQIASLKAVRATTADTISKLSVAYRNISDTDRAVSDKILAKMVELLESI